MLGWILVGVALAVLLADPGVVGLSVVAAVVLVYLVVRSRAAPEQTTGGEDRREGGEGRAGPGVGRGEDGASCEGDQEGGRADEDGPAGPDATGEDGSIDERIGDSDPAS